MKSLRTNKYNTSESYVGAVISDWQTEATDIPNIVISIADYRRVESDRIASRKLLS